MLRRLIVTGQADSRDLNPYKEKTALPWILCRRLRIRLRHRTRADLECLGCRMLTAFNTLNIIKFLLIQSNVSL